MNNETENFLRNISARQEAAKTATEMRPAIEKQAIKEYHQLEHSVRAFVEKFNASPMATKTSTRLKFEGPYHYDHTNMYTLHLHGRKGYPDGRALVIHVPNSSDFDRTRLGVTTWQSHISLEGLTGNLSSYAPGQHPKKLGSESYKMVPRGEAHGWIKEKGVDSGAVTLEGLFDNLVHQLITFNVGVDSH